MGNQIALVKVKRILPLKVKETKATMCKMDLANINENVGTIPLRILCGFLMFLNDNSELKNDFKQLYRMTPKNLYSCE